VVDAHRDGSGESRLIAYVVPRPSARERVAGRLRRRLPNGLSIVEQHVSETDYVYREIFDERAYLDAGVRLPDDACVVDVGANIGLFTLFVTREAPRARVYAFEPIPPLFELLTANASLYAPAARLFGIGLSDRSETQAFTYYPRYSIGSGVTAYASAEQDAAVVRAFIGHEHDEAANRLADADALLADWFEQERYDCPVRRLSDVMRDEGIEHIDLLKIDVQRAELDVLRGIDDDDWPRISAMVLEAHDRPAPGIEGRVNEIRGLLERHGFEAIVAQEPTLAGTDVFAIRARRPAVSSLDTSVAASAALARDEGAGDQVDRAEVLTRDSLRDALARRLPPYMMPAAFALLDDLPRLPNGKIDRAALPDPDRVGQSARPAFVPPANDVERVIAEIWAGALRIPRVGRADGFFDLGGHSLLAVTVHRRLCEALPQHPLRLLDLFKYPTVEALAAFLLREVDAPVSGADDIRDRAAARRRVLGRAQERPRKEAHG
jgi:FkbM family methyltransferase